LTRAIGLKKQPKTFVEIGVLKNKKISSKFQQSGCDS
jgi:hypothetical protein